MGKILAIERDEETGDVPTVGSFAANSMSPFFEQLRELEIGRASCRERV